MFSAEALVVRGCVQDVQYLLVECRNSIPPQRHSQQSEYLCNHKGSTDTENSQGEEQTEGGGRGEREWGMKGVR